MFHKPSLAPARSLEWSRPVIPPRSQLYCLKPFGVGTADVESFSGYVARLAQAHCLRTGALIGWVAGFLTEGTSKQFSVNLNGYSEAANRWRLTIERLTGGTNLHCLTMLILQDVVAQGRNQPTLKSSYAWCPECLRTDSVPYHRLLWALHPVTVCPTHECPLVEICPGCFHKNMRLCRGSHPGYCPLCSGWLGGTGINSRTQGYATVLPEGELAYRIRVARVAGELLAIASSLPATPTVNPFGHALRAATRIDGVYFGPNAVPICRALELASTTIHNWTSLRAKPTLSSLLDFCVKVNASVTMLLTQGKLACDRDWLPVRPIRDGNRRKKGSRRVIGEGVRQILEKFVQSSSSPPLSLAQVCRELGYSSRTLRRHFPQPCAQIAANFGNYKHARARARRDRLTEEIARAVERIHAEDKVPTGSRVRRLLGNSNLLRKEGIRTAFFEARRKLGMDRE
jgi:AraC-like DNA-binding protein